MMLSFDFVYYLEFSKGTGAVWLENFRCTGLERQLSRFNVFNWGKLQCLNSQFYAGIVCGLKSNAMYFL